MREAFFRGAFGLPGRAAVLAAVTGVALVALPALAARKHVKAPAAARPEDDLRLKGDAKAFDRAAVSFKLPEDQAELSAEEPVRIEFQLVGYAIGAVKPAGTLAHALGATKAAGPVPHLHLIVDNEPAFEVDDAATPLLLRGLARGPHMLRLVLCRPWHEVVKAPHAFALTRFWVGPKLEGKSGHAAEFVAWPDPHKPLVTYVLPAGDPPHDLRLDPVLTYETMPDPSVATPGEGSDDEAREDDSNAAKGAKGSPGASHAQTQRREKPVLDFYLSNVKLGRRGDKLRVVLDKRELPLVTEWKPQHLRRARPGPHKITIDLLNRRGLKVKNAFNRTDRAFVSGG
ncbi:MAG TPA: DUF6130 family protein [Myxococcales bacterium]